MTALQLLAAKKSLTREQCSEAITAMLDQPVQMAAFLALLSVKGETVEEILGLVQAMRSQMQRLSLEQPVLDIVGTGGDQAGTVNISTGSALMAAKCGIPIVKHGNRSVSSQCGSADVLEALGYNIHQTPTEIQESVNKHGFGFCFAPDYHPVMKKVRPVRETLKIPTAFNVIGPLLNPAGTEHLQIGVYRPDLVPILAEVLFRLGTKRSLVYCGHGIDELSCIDTTHAILVTDRGLEPLIIDPKQLGFACCTLNDLKGSDAQTNAKLLENPPPRLRDTLLLNVGVALFLYGSVNSIAEGVKLAKRKFRRSLKKSLQEQTCSVIAELKQASPSKGKIAEIPNLAERALFYQNSGAIAISVLTSERFAGKLSDLKSVMDAVSIPVLRKDFITRREQIAETDADVILLIVAYLGEQTREFLNIAREFNLEAIVEVHTSDELEIALAAGSEIIGVNQRNLKDFTMHPEVYALIEKIHPTILRIAESGVRNYDDAKRLFAMGYDAILVGEALSLNAQLCEDLCSLKYVD